MMACFRERLWFIALIIACGLRCNGAPLASSNDQQDQEETVLGLKYLRDYGYIAEPGGNPNGPRESLSEDWFESAVREFQQFMGLEKTGRMDKQTISYMGRNRCGNRDVAQAESTTGRQPINQEEPDETEEEDGRKRKRRYALAGSKWPRDLITYRLAGASSSKRASESDLEDDLDKAFQLWASVAPLRFERRRHGRVDIEIKFVKDKHEGCVDELGSSSIQLAHAFQPGKMGLAGDIHFNDHFRWAAGHARGGEPWLPVAIHEIGHSLGLDHSNLARAIMFPINLGLTNLTSDDRRAILTLYGPTAHFLGKASTCSTTSDNTGDPCLPDEGEEYELELETNRKA